jgi:hypothetical protein
MTEIAGVQVGFVKGQQKLEITFSDTQVVHIPLTEQVALVLNAGGWMMREHSARVFEADLGGPNLVSRRIRMIDVNPPSAEG